MHIFDLSIRPEGTRIRPIVNTSGDAKSYLSRQVESSRLFFVEPASDADFMVVFGGFERCRPDYRIDRQTFPWFCLEFVDRGKGSLVLADEERELQSGSFFLYGPNVSHRITTDPENPLRKYFVGFGGPAAADFLERSDLTTGMAAFLPKADPIRRAFESLIERGARKSRFASEICSLITRQLLLMCGDDATEPADTGTPSYARYCRVRDFIEKHHLEVSSLGEIASACELDAPYLCRIFSKYHHESPYRFLTRLRMEHAARILLETEASVGSVALGLGYSDAFHFSRVFKSVHHVPPSRFRQSTHPQWPG